MCIPNNQEIREKLLAEAHDTQLSGHLGVNKTVAQLRRRFWWPAMAESVADYVRTCGLCQVNKPSSKRKLGLLQPLEIPERRWGSVSMDQIVELPKTNDGFDSIVVYVDRLTKMMHCQPTHTNVTAPVLAHIFFDTVVRLHGLPDNIVSDRDPKFTGHFWRALFKHVGVKLSMSTAFHPQTDGQTERDNRTLESILRNFVSTNFDNWDTLLPAAEFSYNNSVQKSTQETPFYLNYGMHPVTPLDRITDAPIDTDVMTTTSFLKTIKKANDSARDHITKAQQRQKKGYDGLREEHTFKVGDLVKLSTKDTPIEKGPAYKLKPRYVGPLEVLKVVSPVAYRITLPENWRIHNVLHIFALRP